MSRCARPRLRCALLAVALLSPAIASADGARVDAVADETERILRDKIDQREALLRARVRAAYKDLRTSGQESWLSSSARARSLFWASAVRRILRRDTFELHQLETELETVREGRAMRVLGPHPAPAPESLAPPLSRLRVARPFGLRRERGGHEIVRRGLELRVGSDREVRASASGVVVYSGDLSSLGGTLVIDHGTFTTVLGRVEEIELAPGDEVERGQRLGRAADRWLHFEVRVPGVGPVDPRPLIGDE